MDWAKPELIVAIFAGLISTAALITSITSVIHNHRHNRLVMRPRLAFDFLIRPGTPVASVDLVNRGMGPATVTKFDFYIDGQPPNAAGLHRFEDVTTHLGLPTGTVLSLLLPPESVAIGERIQLISVPISNYTQETAEKVRAGFRRVRYTVEYAATDGGEVFVESGDGKQVFPLEAATQDHGGQETTGGAH